eukprot:7301679-Pyramimonas_sp.AAC.1
MLLDGPRRRKNARVRAMPGQGGVRATAPPVVAGLGRPSPKGAIMPWLPRGAGPQESSARADGQPTTAWRGTG